MCTVECFNISTNARQSTKRIHNSMISIRKVCSASSSSSHSAILKIKDPNTNVNADGVHPAYLKILLTRKGKKKNYEVFSKFIHKGKLTIRVPWAGRQIMLKGACEEWCHKVIAILDPSQTKFTKRAQNSSIKEPMADKTNINPKNKNEFSKKSQYVPRRFQQKCPLSPAVCSRKKTCFSQRSPGQVQISSSSPVIASNAKRRRPVLYQPTSIFQEAGSSSQSVPARTNIPNFMDANLSDGQANALNLVKAGKTIFLTGGAGTGKTRTIFSCCSWAASVGKRVSITATTGVAACNVDGVTVHSWSGVSSRELVNLNYSAQDILDKAITIVRKLRQHARMNWLRTDLLVIDEISMLDPFYLDLLDKCGQIIRKNSSAFGGIQLVFVGDFHQLPAVQKKNPSGTACKQNDNRMFAFESRCFRNLFENKGPGKVCILKVVHRQGSDASFVSLLSRARKGLCTEEDILRLRSCKSNNIVDSMDMTATHLCTHVRDAVQKNKREMNRLPGLHHTFKAQDWSMSAGAGAILNSSCRALAEIELAIGAQVILIKTIDAAAGLVNGARGVIRGFTPKTGMPIVEFSNGIRRTIIHQRWSIEINGRQLAARKQLPLDLAWAISIHKSQGMTLDTVVLNLSRVFECGQGYVALSRVRSLSGLKVEGQVSAASFKANPKVSAFYARFEHNIEST